MQSAFRPKKAVLRALFLAGLVVLLGAMVVSYRSRGEEIEELRAQLDTLNTQYYAESMRGNTLTSQLNQANTDAFIERVARREYGYMNQGEIHYKVSNLPSDTQMDVVQNPEGEQ